MTDIQPINELRVFYERTEDERIVVGRLAFRNSVALFEYDPDFRALGIELSPFKLAVAEGLLRAKPQLFEGMFGLFDDSLPDGWGRLILDRHIARLGGDPATLTPLDRLAWVGDRAIGALSYEPNYELVEPDAIDLHALGEETRIVLEDRTSDALETLLSLGGSPQGARPKALVLVSTDGKEVAAGSMSREGFCPYLVKFSAASDPRDSAGAIEYAYSRMAEAAGVVMPKTRLLEARGDHRGFFAIERFDRRKDQRLHVHTISGLLDAQPGVTAMRYGQVLKATHVLTKDAREVKQMFRRAAFNVFCHNRDDHSRNFAFMMEPDGTWKLAPAYDLTFAAGPRGEHTMLVGAEAKNPKTSDLMKLATDAGIKEKDAVKIVDEVRGACSRWAEFADEAALDAKERNRIGAALSAVDRAAQSARGVV